MVTNKGLALKRLNIYAGVRYRPWSDIRMLIVELEGVIIRGPRVTRNSMKHGRTENRHASRRSVDRVYLYDEKNGCVHRIISTVSCTLVISDIFMKIELNA